MTDTAAIYTRVSTARQGERGTSLESQRADCERLAADLGLTVAGVWTDTDTGAEINLPGLNALLDAAQAGTFGVLLVHHPDRLARRLAKQLAIEDLLRRAGVRLQFVNVRVDDSPEGRLQRNILGSIAEFERERIAFRTARGRREKARRGEVPGASVVPFGYRWQLDDRGTIRGLIPVASEACIVRRIFRELASQTVDAVAESLQADGLKTSRGGVWTQGAVYRIARNTTYMGQFAYGRRRDRQRIQPDDAGAWINVPVPPLVDRATWDAAQDALHRRRWARKGRYADQADDPYLLRGRLRCGHCQRVLVTVKRRSSERYYACLTGRQGASRAAGEAVCEGRYYRAVELERAVWGHVAALLRDPRGLRRGARDVRAKHAAAEARHADRTAVLGRQVERGRARLARLLRARLDVDEGGESDRLLAADARALEEQLRRLEAERQALPPPPPPSLAEQEITALTDFAHQVGVGLARAEPTDQRFIYEQLALAGTVTVDPHGVEVGPHRVALALVGRLGRVDSVGDLKRSAILLTRA